jgi:hypothetical protein
MKKVVIASILFTFLLPFCQGQNEENNVIRDELSAYFPLEVFTDTSLYIGYDTFCVTWYSIRLYLMEEPVIYTNNSHNEIYRFTWLRSFDNPIAVRIEKQKNTYMLYWKCIDSTGKLIIDKQKELDEATWIEFKNWLNQIDFWNMKTNQRSFALDGAQWILEGKTDIQYHVVDRQSPDKNSKYYRCCDFLINLTDLEISFNEKY